VPHTLQQGGFSLIAAPPTGQQASFTLLLLLLLLLPSDEPSFKRCACLLGIFTSPADAGR